MYFAGRATKGESDRAKAAVASAGYALARNATHSTAVVVLLGDPRQRVVSVGNSVPHIALAALPAWLAANPAAPPPPAAAPAAALTAAPAAAAAAPAAAAAATAAAPTTCLLYKTGALLTADEMDEVDAAAHAILVLGTVPAKEKRALSWYESAATELHFFTDRKGWGADREVQLTPDYEFAHVPCWLPGFAAAHAAVERRELAGINKGLHQLQHAAVTAQRTRANFLCQFFLALRAAPLFCRGDGRDACRDGVKYVRDLCSAFRAALQFNDPPGTRAEWRKAAHALVDNGLACTEVMGDLRSGILKIRNRAKWRILENIVRGLLGHYDVHAAIAAMSPRAGHAELDEYVCKLAALHCYGRPDVCALIAESAAALGRQAPPQLEGAMRQSLWDSSQSRWVCVKHGARQPEQGSMGEYFSSVGALVCVLQLLHALARSAPLESPHAELCASVPPSEAPSELFRPATIKSGEVAILAKEDLARAVERCCASTSALTRLLGKRLRSAVAAHCGDGGIAIVRARTAGRPQSEGKRQYYVLTTEQCLALQQAVGRARARRTATSARISQAGAVLHRVILDCELFKRMAEQLPRHCEEDLQQRDLQAVRLHNAWVHLGWLHNGSSCASNANARFVMNEEQRQRKKYCKEYYSSRKLADVLAEVDNAKELLFKVLTRSPYVWRGETLVAASERAERAVGAARTKNAMIEIVTFYQAARAAAWERQVAKLGDLWRQRAELEAAATEALTFTYVRSGACYGEVGHATARAIWVDDVGGTLPETQTEQFELLRTLEEYVIIRARGERSPAVFHVPS